MRYQKHISISFIFFLTFLYASFSFAQSSSITNGLTYLQSTQSLEGYWGDVSEVPYNSFVDTCTVAETLKYLNEIGTAYNTSIQWINTTEIFNSDYLFAKMLILAQAGIDISSIRDYLMSLRNDDGGWGATEGFTSDIKRTTLALQALKAVNYSDQTVIDNALSYLLSTQNTDGGFGFYPSPCSGCEGDESNVYMTALVSITLQQFQRTTSIATAINKATSYLIAHQNTEGGFGSSLSTVYETALVYLALVGDPSTSSGLPLQNAINYLTSTQLPNGSWDDDPYSTALALRALANVKPNLSISSNDISFSNPTPIVGETITITAKIKNTGPSQADNVLLQFYAGAPSVGRINIG
ncbi:MAG: prenyltransferase/squalene oxidase repeat-containing protein [Nitrospirota bacterium]